jgi:hypothetical protein
MSAAGLLRTGTSIDGNLCNSPGAGMLGERLDTSSTVQAPPSHQRDREAAHRPAYQPAAIRTATERRCLWRWVECSDPAPESALLRESGSGLRPGIRLQSE